MLSHFDFCFGLKTNVTFVSLSFSFWLVLFDFFYIQPWSCHLILPFPGLCMVIVFLPVFIVVLKSFITFVFVFFYFLCFCPFFFLLPFTFLLGFTDVCCYFLLLYAGFYFCPTFFPGLLLFAKPKRFANVCCFCFCIPYLSTGSVWLVLCS